MAERTEYIEDAAQDVADALNATGEVRAEVGTYGDEITVSRSLSGGWQRMGRVTLEFDDEGYVTIGELPSRRRSWVRKIVADAIGLD